MKKSCKIININYKKNMEFLLMQLDELTDKNSVHFDQDVFKEKDKIREKILKGEIVLE